MKSAEIRRQFLEFFKAKGHEVVASSSLVPGNDPTLLFTNAGMVQFKDVFLGVESRPYQRAATSQRCVRAGGKHNDLENVGYTARHHTFFEMLGNFSFGDYFKRDAIQYAWELLTGVFGIPAEKLWVTVFEEDDEAADIWLNEMKIDPKRFSRCGEKDNFWAMGDSGPCGPCSEIFYDHGPEIPGGPPGSEGADLDRYIEIWNLVFMQFNREPNGKMTRLPNPSVDTGMGLERVSAVLQKVHSNYEIDLFQNLIAAIAKLAGTDDLTHTSLRVIADHIRSTAFLIVDGVVPANEGRGYVLRRIIRRALRHGNKLGLHEPFFYKLVKPLCDEMGSAYPELTKAKNLVEQTLKREEEIFATTLEQGLKILEQQILDLNSTVIPGEVSFKLYDTYGFPLDLTADIARERGLTIDEDGFHAEMTKQRERSQKSSKFAADYDARIKLDAETIFTGYENLKQSATVVAILSNNQPVERLAHGEEGVIVLDQSPFYAESGGQIGDRGQLTSSKTEFTVTDTLKKHDAILHYGKLSKGHIQVGDRLDAEVDNQRRRNAALNHSATHLLNAALRELIGEHVLQKGSLVVPERLRFDFSHFEALRPDQHRALEQLVNQKIRENLLVETKIMTPEEAMDSGAMALFGEKYGNEVRVLCMGDFSMELCGGTHVSRTGDIGLFKIVSETGIAAGIRRIEAVTGEYALNYIDSKLDQLSRVASHIKTSEDKISDKVQLLLTDMRQLEKDNKQLKAKAATSVGSDLSAGAQKIGDVDVLVQRMENLDAKSLRDVMDKIKQKFSRGIVVLATVNDGKVSVVAGISQTITDHYHAGELIKAVTEQIDGTGGGRADMAQGGGSHVENLDRALESVFDWVKRRQN